MITILNKQIILNWHFNTTRHPRKSHRHLGISTQITYQRHAVKLQSSRICCSYTACARLAAGSTYAYARLNRFRFHQGPVNSCVFVFYSSYTLTLYICFLAFCFGQQIQHSTEGTCEGTFTKGAFTLHHILSSLAHSGTLPYATSIRHKGGPKRAEAWGWIPHYEDLAADWRRLQS